MRITGLVATVLGWSCILLVSTAACAEPAVTATRHDPCPKLKTVVGIPIVGRSEDGHFRLWPLTKFGKLDSDYFGFEVTLYGPQMRIGKKTVFVEKVKYSFRKGRVSSACMTVHTEQGQSETYVGKRKANTVDDIRAVADFILKSGTVLRNMTSDHRGIFDVAVPGWKAPMECLLQEKSLTVFCMLNPFRRATGNKAADKKVDLTIGGIPLGPGAALDDVVRLGPSLLKDRFDPKITLTGPAVTYGKKKLKISRLEYTFACSEYPQMLAVVEAGKDNSSGDLKALYEHIKGKVKSPQEQTSPGKRETWGKFGPGKGTYLRCLLTTRKNSSGDQVAARLEMMYPTGKGTLDPPVSDIEEYASGKHWKQSGGRWVYESRNKTLLELAKLIGTPPTTVKTLIKDLASKKRDTRLLAVCILGKGGPAISRSAIPALKKVAAGDSDPVIRKAAAVAIKDIMKKASPRATTRPVNSGKRILDRPAPGIEKKVKIIEAIVNGGQWKRVDGRWVFMNTHWIFDGKRWVKEKSAVDLAIVMGLDDIEGAPTAKNKEPPTTVDVLIKVLASKSWEIRLRAILILGKGGPGVSRSAIPALKKALKDSNPHVRKAATAAIKKIVKKTSPKATSRPK